MNSEPSLSVVEKLRQLVEQACHDELPEGLCAEFWDNDGEAQPPPSQYEMWSALTALTQEVRLQGRAFKALEDSLTPVQDGLRGYGSAVELAKDTADKAWEVTRQRLVEARRQGEEKAREEFLGTLVDCHDRLLLGLESARECRQALPTTRAWWLGGRAQWSGALESVDSLVDGCGLSLLGLSDCLQRHGVTTIACLGLPFDPLSMNAVAVERTEAVAEGIVLEVLRPGYLHKGNVFRAAQVKVARLPEKSGE